MSRYRLYILDLDGTVYRGDEPTPGAAGAIARLRSEGAVVRFLTNNSGRTREFFRDKLLRMGIPAEVDDIHSSATGTAAWCSSEAIGSALVVGEEGLFDALQRAGIKTINVGEEDPAEGADAVVVGICRSFTYRWMNSAMQVIRRGARFVATNVDPTYPLEGGRLEPGAGSIVAAIRTCSGVEPFVVGKPNPYLIEAILKDTGVPPTETLVVGDRDTDVVAGSAAGCAVHLVLTGISKEPVSGQNASQDLTGLP